MVYTYVSVQQFHGSFYFNPNNLTMAAGDIMDLYTGYSGTTQVFAIQLQKSGASYQVRASARNDSGSWTNSAWQTLASGWNNLEVEYLAGNLTGQMNLYLSGSKVQSLTALDTDLTAIDSVRLGTMGIDVGTTGTIYFDDYDSRRFSKIGPLPDPGTHDPIPTPVPNWTNKSYSYADGSHKHAVTSVTVTDEENVQTTNSYTYDANGSDLCTPELILREGQHDLPR